MEERREANAKIISFMAVAAEKLDTIHSDVKALDTKVGIQNGRIFKLEIWQAWILGGAALLGILASIATTVLMFFKK